MAYEVVDFSDIVDAVVAELKLDPNDANEIIRIKRDINLVYRDEVVPKRRWKWLMGHVAIRHEAYLANGTVSVTPGSATITFSTAPAQSKAGYYFSVDNYSEIYKIVAHTAGVATATLSTTFTGSLNSVATYKVWTDEVALPTNLRETFEVWHDFSTEPMRPVGLQEFRRQVKLDPKYAARPSYYTTYDYADPSSGDGEHESDRYRLMLVYPSMSDVTTTLKIDYVKEIASLDADGDEPVLPIEDRIVLVYGALERAWRRARNPEEAANNRALFDRKLSLMEGRVEDTFDTPQIVPRSEYMARKRSRGVRERGGAVSSGGTYQIPTYLANTTINGANLTGNVTAVAGVTVDGRDPSVDGGILDGHVAASSGVHGVTGSVLGTNDAQTVTNKVIDADQNTISNISNTSVKAGAGISRSKLESGTADHVVINSGTGTFSSEANLAVARGGTNSGAALSNNRVMQSSGGAIVEASAITASRALESDSNGIPTHSATTSAELGYLSGVTSAVQTQLNGKEPSITTLPVSKGGTNSGAALNNNRIMQSSAGAVVEAAAVTANRALISDSNGIPTHSSTTNTELGYVAGVTSAIQTQLDGKIANTLTTTTGDIIYASSANTPARLAIGSSNQVLTVSGGLPSWQAAPSGLLSITSKTANYTATTSDNIINCDASGGAFTITLYAASGNSGRQLTIRKTDDSLANKVTIDGNGSETIDGALTRKLCTQFESVTLVCDGTNWIIKDRKIPSVATSYSPSARSTGTAGTYGSSNNLDVHWTRSGTDIIVTYAYEQTAAGTDGTGTYYFDLPSGLTVSSIMDSANSAVSLGDGYYFNGTTEFDCFVRYGDSTGFTLTRLNSGTYASIGPAGAGGYADTTVRIGFIARVPITDWEG